MLLKYINKRLLGHLAALFTIFVWGVTFVSTKILLVEFKPVEILVFRFVMGLLALYIICPHRLKNAPIKTELTFALAGFLGICLYYLLENIALVYTLASNCGVIMSCAPFITAILGAILLKNTDNTKEKLSRRFFAGFFVAIAGIILICFNGAEFKLNPLGDFLALLAAVAWGFYSIVSKKISELKYPLIPVVRRTFFYGILFMMPASFFFNADFTLAPFFENPVLFLNIVFLGLFASAACFVTWNFALKTLGVVKTSIYLYLVPVITVLSSCVVLGEPFTGCVIFGTLLTISGLFISKKK